MSQGMKNEEKENTFCISISEKGRDLTQSYDKSPYTDRTIQKAT